MWIKCLVQHMAWCGCSKNGVHSCNWNLGSKDTGSTTVHPLEPSGEEAALGMITAAPVVGLFCHSRCLRWKGYCASVLLGFPSHPSQQSLKYVFFFFNPTQSPLVHCSSPLLQILIISLVIITRDSECWPLLQATCQMTMAPHHLQDKIKIPLLAVHVLWP